MKGKEAWPQVLANSISSDGNKIYVVAAGGFVSGTVLKGFKVDELYNGLEGYKDSKEYHGSASDRWYIFTPGGKGGKMATSPKL
jgi:hypothetical protein